MWGEGEGEGEGEGGFRRYQALKNEIRRKTTEACEGEREEGGGGGGGGRDRRGEGGSG